MRIALNRLKPNNYAFFDPVSRTHLTLSDPIATVNEVTKPIERALKTKTILQLDGEEVKGSNEKANKEQPSKPQEEPKTEEKPVEGSKEVKEESEVKETAAPKKRGGRAKKTAE